MYGDHSKEFAEINFFNKKVSQNPIAEVTLMIYDNLGYNEENFHWESNVISIDLSSYETVGVKILMLTQLRLKMILMT